MVDLQGVDGRWIVGFQGVGGYFQIVRGCSRGVSGCSQGVRDYLRDGWWLPGGGR